MTPENHPDFANARSAAGGSPAEIPSEHAIHRDGIISRFQMSIFSAVILFILGCVFIILGITRSEVYLSLIGVVAVAGGTACLGYVLKNMYRGVRRVLLTGTGIQWQDDQSAHEKKWADVREVYTKDVLTRGDRDTDVRVVFADGSSMTMDNRLKKYETLRKSLFSLSSGVLLAKKRQDLAAGKAEFGPVVLHRDGIQGKFGPALLPRGAVPGQEDKKRWEELEQWTVNNGYLYIISTDPKDRYGWEVDLFNIPNYPVLFQLLQEVWQASTPAGMSIPFGGGKRKSGQ
jgi:hypothetical protein